MRMIPRGRWGTLRGLTSWRGILIVIPQRLIQQRHVDVRFSQIREPAHVNLLTSLLFHFTTLSYVIISYAFTADKGSSKRESWNERCNLIMRLTSEVDREMTLARATSNRPMQTTRDVHARAKEVQTLCLFFFPQSTNGYKQSCREKGREACFNSSVCVSQETLLLFPEQLFQSCGTSIIWCEIVCRLTRWREVSKEACSLDTAVRDGMEKERVSTHRVTLELRDISHCCTACFKSNLLFWFFF